MKVEKDDVIAALRIRYDYYSAQTMFDVAREKAGLPDAAALDASQLAAFREALMKVGDRLERVDERLASLGGTAPVVAEKVETAEKVEKTEKAENTEKADKAAAKEPATIDAVIALAGIDADEGEQILVCGGGAELGDWDPSKARPMTKQGDVWVTKLSLAVGADVAFKFLLKTAGGDVQWEAGENRTAKAASRIDATWR